MSWVPLAVVAVQLVTGCGPRIIAPLTGPPDRALVKLSGTTPDGRDSDCTNQIVICDVDGKGRPEAVDFWSVQGKPRPSLSGVDFEVSPRGSKTAWINGALVTPGKHVLRIENNFRYCGDESRWRQYAGMAVISPMFAGAMAVEQAREKAPAFVEFAAEPGKSYVVDCNFEWTPWARISPEGER